MGCVLIDEWLADLPAPSPEHPLPFAVPTFWQMVAVGRWRLINTIPPSHEFLDGELALWLRETTARLLEPRSENFRLIAQECLEDLQAEAQKRVKAAERRERLIKQGQSWQASNFLAEVEAALGHGLKKGKAYWFRCPFHEDKTPSFEVDDQRKLWHCFGCGRAGGVLDFRKALGDAGGGTRP